MFYWIGRIVCNHYFNVIFVMRMTMLVIHAKCSLKMSLTVLSVFCVLCQRNEDNQILYKYFYCTVLYVILIKFIKQVFYVVYPI